jgi:hypothetical protein
MARQSRRRAAHWYGDGNDDNEVPVHDSTDHTKLSATTAVLLFAVLPATLLLTLIGLSYLFGNWS